MIKSLLLSTLAVVGLQSYAMDASVQSVVQSLVVKSIRTHGLNWNVGDSADYSLAGGGGVLNGKAHMFVREAADPGFWMEQDVDLGSLGQEKVETLVNKDNGQVVEMIVNGQKQDPPASDDETVVDSHKDHITVTKFPNGADCFWVKVHSKSQNSDSQMWVNPELVPIAGMLKMIAPSQLGDITLELTDFSKKQ
jgi:hypothetical protein